MRGIGVTAAALIMLSACDTEVELQKQELELLAAEERGLKSLDDTLKDVIALEGSGRVSMFLSKDLINAVLTGASGVNVNIPGVEGAKVRVNSMQTEFRLGLPLVR